MMKNDESMRASRTGGLGEDGADGGGVGGGREGKGGGGGDGWEGDGGSACTGKYLYMKRRSLLRKFFVSTEWRDEIKSRLARTSAQTSKLKRTKSN